MENQSIYNVDKLEFRQIVLGHIKRILEISSHELRDNTYTTNHVNYSQTTFQEDTRNSYTQSIENLAYVLMPYFDKDMQEIYDKCIAVINAFGYELRLDILKEEYEKICEDVGEEKTRNFFVIQMKLKYAKKLFIALNMLLKRNDYLKSAVYGEDKDELVSGDDEEDGAE